MKYRQFRKKDKSAEFSPFDVETVNPETGTSEPSEENVRDVKRAVDANQL